MPVAPSLRLVQLLGHVLSICLEELQVPIKRDISRRCGTAAGSCRARLSWSCNLTRGTVINLNIGQHKLLCQAVTKTLGQDFSRHGVVQALGPCLTQRTLSCIYHGHLGCPRRQHNADLFRLGEVSKTFKRCHFLAEDPVKCRLHNTTWFRSVTPSQTV